MIKAIIILFVLILLSFQDVIAINYRELDRDSLKAIVNNKSLPDTTRLLTACYLTVTYDYVMPDSMLYYSRIFQEESVKANYLYGIAYTRVTEGWYYSMMGKKKEAMKFYLSAIKPAEECGKPLILGFVYGEVGSGYAALGIFDKAGEFLLRSVKIYRAINEPERELNSMQNLAHVYANSGNEQKAIDILLQIIHEVDSLKTEDFRSKASALDQLGSIYRKTGKPVEAVKAYDEALKLHMQARNLFFYRITLGNLASFFILDTMNIYGKVIGDDRKSVDITISYLEELEIIARDIKDTCRLAECTVMLARTYLSKGEKKKALDKLMESQQLNLINCDIGSTINYTTELTEIYSTLGEYKKALEQSRRLIFLMDSVDRDRMAETVSRLTESFEIEQVEGQLTQKEEQLKTNRYITYLFIAISALILILALIVSYFLRQKQKAARLLEQQNREIEQARNRAEQSEKFKERFLASMSHEIRTPLNAVIGMTGLLLDEQQAPKTENYLKNIKQAGEHLTGIINEILDLSKIDAGKLELHEAPFSLNKLLEETERLLSVRAKEKGLLLIINKPEGTPDWVFGDSGRIRQVLLNLAGNAVKFTEQGSVQIQMTSKESGDDKVLCTFSIADTGPGIPKAMQAAIFEEFVQAEQGEDQKVAGTGLGLSIARKLVERMGGALMLESEPGKGSVFSFTIPLILSSEEAYLAGQKEKEITNEALMGAFRILVVEDNPSNQIVTQGMLEKILPESTATTAEDGFKALDLLGKEKFDLVLMDIRMPGIDGYETTRRLRRLENENAKIPVVALTASVIRADIQHCLEAGMNGYVAKPVSRNFLAKTLREQLKIAGEEIMIRQDKVIENFLSNIPGRPAWSDHLFEICNGKKDRFIRYLDIFLAQSKTELGPWEDYIENKKHEELAFSIHKILPHIRIFMEEKTAAMAVMLDQELRKGWTESHSENILLLKQKINALYKEAGELLQVVSGS
jgi:signal transduction histidine kinase/response regulator RpfG family c-di-GMP phosphodiesterase